MTPHSEPKPLGAPDRSQERLFGTGKAKDYDAMRDYQREMVATTDDPPDRD